MTASNQKPVTIEELLSKAAEISEGISGAMQSNRNLFLAAGAVAAVAFLVGYRFARKR